MPGDRDWATQVQECIPLLPLGRQEMPGAATRAQPGMLKGKSQCLGIGMSLLSLPVPPAPSPGWAPPFFRASVSPQLVGQLLQQWSSLWPPRSPVPGEQHAIPALPLGSLPGRTQAALVCSLASVPALPSPPPALGQEVSPPRPTNRLEWLLVPRGGETVLPGARRGQTPKPTPPCAPPPSQRSHSSPQSQPCQCPAACAACAAGWAPWVGAAGGRGGLEASQCPRCPSGDWGARRRQGSGACRATQ